MHRSWLWMIILTSALAVGILSTGLAQESAAPAEEQTPSAEETAGNESGAVSQNAEETPAESPEETAANEAPETESEEPSEADEPTEDEPQTTKIATMSLRGMVLESRPGFTLFGESGEMTTQDWLLRLGKARNDDDIAAVLLRIESPELNLSQATELADAIRRLDKVKPVYTFLVSGGFSEYILASAGRKVSMEPIGTLYIPGVAMEAWFFADTLAWLGIEPQFVQIGKFKGAAEPMENTSPSALLQKELNKLADSRYALLVDVLARHRGLEESAVRTIIDQGLLSADEARKCKMVDYVVTTGEWRDMIRTREFADQQVGFVEQYGGKKSPGLNMSNPFALMQIPLQGKEPTITDPTVAIIYADGMIVPDSSGENIFGGKLVGARTMEKCFDQARDDDRIKAVVLRINSPGGSAEASERIFQAARRCAEVKPVLVNISSLGASGGYYIALGGERIYAEQASIVGSIGVVSGKLAIEQTLSKLHVHTFSITRGKHAGLELSAPWSPQQLELIRHHAERTYEIFTDRVKESRGEKIADIETVAQGRMFSARAAKANGLVDEIGGLHKTVQAAHQAAGIEGPANYLVLPRPRTLADLLSGDTEASSSRAAELPGASGRLLCEIGRMQPQLGRGLGYLLGLADLLGRERVLTAMPCHLHISP